MPKDYLTFEQVCETLGKSAEEVNRIIADGRLTEVRDGDKVFYKNAEVEQIAAKEGSSIVDLALTEEADAEETETFASALSSLADDSSGLAALDESPGVEPVPEAIPELDVPDAAPAELDVAAEAPAELSLEDIPEDLPAAPADEAEPAELVGEIDLTAPGSDEIPDLGLSGSSILGLEPGEAEAPPAAAEAPAEEEPSAPKVGISVFDDDEIEIETDPMGETQISAGVEELETVGSGSGLLDLTRETDDTSLGAELLDVISPTDAAGETEAEGEVLEVQDAEETVEDSGPEMTVVDEEEEGEPAIAGVASAPARVAAITPGGAFVNVCALVGLLGLVLAAFATVGYIQGVWPELLNHIVDADVVRYSVFGGLALVAIITGVLSMLAGRNK
jgi:hypothetical protein